MPIIFEYTEEFYGSSFQLAICKRFPESKPYEIFETKKYWNDYKGLFIDVRGIFTENEMVEEHQRECYQKFLGVDSYLSTCEVEDIENDFHPFELARRLVKQIEEIVENIRLIYTIVYIKIILYYL